MIPNKAKRNIWLTISIILLICALFCAVTVVNHTDDWWQFFTITILFAIAYKRYKTHNRNIKKPNFDKSPS